MTFVGGFTVRFLLFFIFMRTFFILETKILVISIELKEKKFFAVDYQKNSSVEYIYYVNYECLCSFDYHMGIF